MTEIVLAFSITLVTFGLFVLVMLKKERSTRDDPAKKCACARCDCQGDHPPTGKTLILAKPPEGKSIGKCLD